MMLPDGKMDEDLKSLLEASRSLSWSGFGKRIVFYAPSFARYKNPRFPLSRGSFPSISITGNACALNCKHCGGKVLRTMIPATTPDELVATCRRIKGEGGRGCLISGGCLPNGSVPLTKFIDAIGQIKRELGLTIIVHTGVVDEEAGKALAEAGVDAALIDIIGSRETIKEIYNLELSVNKYEASLKSLHDSGVTVVPHVLVGLHYGRLNGEIKALEMIQRYRPGGVVVIALTPLKGTPMESIPPPNPEDVAWILAKARIMMPETPLALGCMRPKGAHRIRMDQLAVMAGVNAIAFPVEEAIELAESMGLKLSYSEVCCSQIYEDLITFKRS